jgi:hypothetical protein
MARTGINGLQIRENFDARRMGSVDAKIIHYAKK